MRKIKTSEGIGRGGEQGGKKQRKGQNEGEETRIGTVGQSRGAEGGGQRGGKEADERKSRVVRHKRNSFGDTGTPLSCSLAASSSSFPLAPSISPISPGPETPCFFTGLWDFFHADRRVVHQRGLTVNLLFSLFLRYARTLVRVPPRKQKKEREKGQAGKEGGTIKKSKCQPP